ncbi:MULTISPECIES: DUF5715 family protein [Chryseobacterium]|jgi:hypothetical protein|uniref:Peptidase M15-like protein n=1 Tax=Chryseobacterium geocarposphaerae TaxID=1416776 RepID=A0ABU1LD64_9FLAO|nr:MULTISPECIES: DUF5715 family protein [Chryseobacterium]ALR31164.1 hypothetical protein ATE47_11800 [Chryseobacterium sp. IHB B 17019]MDR6404662.1 hypothetical protein [Chryseobacterium geocarposphaerae]MDR6698105.1 hypothetical protein [Chryseobacterium ginsenosidimutans]
MKKFLFVIFVSFIYTSHYSQMAKKILPCYDLTEVLKVEPTALYKPHLDASKSFGVKLLKDSKTVQKYINSGKFHKIKKSGKGYRVQKLDYSRGWMVSKGKLMLEKMGARFSKETKGHTFTVSSITRTLEDQCRLRKINSNAALGISSHNYGNSFDISYVRFNDVLKYNPKMEAALEKVLKYYYNAGRIYYIKEKQQSCYHVTVRNY